MNSKIVIIGGCAGAKVAYDIFASAGYFCQFMENYTKRWGQIPDNRCVETVDFGSIGWFVATGDNAERERMFAKYRDLFPSAPRSATHRSAQISRFCRIGDGALICANAVVGVGAELGHGVIVNTAASVDHDCQVDDFAQIGPGARICGYVGIGKRAFIGAGATVIPYIKIAHDAVVAAGAVVTKDVGPHEMVAGVPAERKKVLA